ncbi:MAG: DUF2752 domain-containing protein [bacterium]
MSWERGRRPTGAQQVALAGALLSVGYVILRSLGRVAPLQCPWRGLVGMKCSLCGTTTTLRKLLIGQPLQALATNPLIALVALVAVAGSVLLVIQLASGWRLRLHLSRRAGRWWLVGFLVAVAVNWVYVLVR